MHCSNFLARSSFARCILSHRAPFDAIVHPFEENPTAWARTRISFGEQTKGNFEIFIITISNNTHSYSSRISPKFRIKECNWSGFPTSPSWPVGCRYPMKLKWNIPIPIFFCSTSDHVHALRSCLACKMVCKWWENPEILGFHLAGFCLTLVG